jgi:Ca2+-binding EF-hand superfamily protein
MDILGNNVSGSEVKRIVNYYDEDANGKISFTEFLKVIFT